MREIKFRVWSQESTKPTRFDEMYYSDIYDNMEAFWREVENIKGDLEAGFDGKFDLMQYTGLTDKNGVEIYEGDIVEAENNIYKVVFSESQAMFVRRRHDGFEMPMFQNLLMFKIIGNIYQNPELLTSN